MKPKAYGIIKKSHQIFTFDSRMYVSNMIMICRPTEGTWQAGDHRLRQHVSDLAMGAAIRQRWQTDPRIRRGDEGQIRSRLD